MALNLPDSGSQASKEVLKKELPRECVCVVSVDTDTGNTRGCPPEVLSSLSPESFGDADDVSKRDNSVNDLLSKVLKKGRRCVEPLDRALPGLHVAFH